MHPTAYEELEKFAASLPQSKILRIGDVGAYDVNGCLRPLFERHFYEGIDVEPGPNVDIVVPPDGPWLNIPEHHFDVVVTVSTLEHTRRPWLVVREIARILKPGGTACICAPYAWALHRYPLDCWRIFPDGMQTIVEDAGMVVQEVYMKPMSGEQGDTVAICVKPLAQVP